MAADRSLSKFLSLILRHAPGKVGLRLDAEGWVPLAELLAAVRAQRGWESVDEARVRAVVDSSDKQRFEIEGDRIRARYGHSVAERVTYPAVEPPEVLYHGTSRRALSAIRRDGLKAMRRQYVHLSTTPDQALAVGRRHDPAPILLTIRAHAAWQAGATFHQPEPRLFLADAIPAEFVEE